MSLFKHFFKVIVVLNFALLLGFFIHYKQNNKVIAVVRTGKVLEKYYGMRELQSTLSKEKDKYSERLDTLLVLYNEARIYLEEGNHLSKNEKREAQNNLIKREKDFTRYKQHSEEKIEEESEKLTQGVLNQMNDAVKVYADENNIDLVVGVTLMGNVMHATSEMDITDKIIEKLNSEY